VCLAIPGRVVEILDEEDQLGQVDVGGVRRTVSLGLLDVADLRSLTGSWVLIHVGFAISQIDEDLALSTLRLLEQMGADYERELSEMSASAGE